MAIRVINPTRFGVIARFLSKGVELPKVKAGKRDLKDY
jgi:hypothetical protein